MTTDNYEKHTTQNPLQKYFIQRFLQKLLSVAKQLSVDSILDVGCGEGFTLQSLQDGGIGKKCEGIEYSDKAIALGKKIHPFITIKKGTIYTLPYKDNAFDLVICTEVLEHLDDPHQALSELSRVAKKYCLLSVPNEPLFMLAGYIRGQKPQDIGHINHWTPDNFKTYVAKHLTIKAVYFPFPWTLLLAEK